jgi:hypothetical protein
LGSRSTFLLRGASAHLLSIFFYRFRFAAAGKWVAFASLRLDPTSSWSLFWFFFGLYVVFGYCFVFVVLLCCCAWSVMGLYGEKREGTASGPKNILHVGKEYKNVGRNSREQHAHQRNQRPDYDQTKNV